MARPWGDLLRAAALFQPAHPAVDGPAKRCNRDEAPDRPNDEKYPRDIKAKHDDAGLGKVWGALGGAPVHRRFAVCMPLT